MKYTKKISELSIKVGKNEIRILGFNSQNSNDKAQLSGLSGVANAEYIFVMFEERFQFSQAEYQSAMEAIRNRSRDRTKEVQVIEINSCNP